MNARRVEAVCRASRRVSVRLLLLPALALVFACTDGESPVSPDARGAPQLFLRPQFSVHGGSSTDVLPINRIRLVARDSATGAILGQLQTDDVDPAAAGWTLSLELRVPEGAGPVVVLVTVELVHVADGAERVQWSGVTAGIRVTPGSTQTPDAPVTLYQGPPENLLVTAVRIEAAPALMEGDSVQLAAAATTSAPTPPQLFWSSLDPDIAVVSAGGLVRGERAGSARVVAAAGPRADTATLLVRQRPTAVRITPAEAQAHSLGAELVFEAAVLDPRGAVIEAESVVWQGEESPVAEHLGGGRVRTRGNGSYELVARAAADPALYARATLTVTQQPAAIEVAPAVLRFEGTGGSTRLSATVRDANGNPLSGAPVQWASDNPAVATVDGTGLVRATGVGRAGITVRAGTVEATAAVVVEHRPAVVRVEPGSMTLDALGASASASATVHADDGTPLSLPVTWSSSDPAVASVSASGLITAHRNGAATITATHAALAAALGVEVRQRARTVAVEPADASVPLGETTALSAVARDANGHPVDGPLEWSTQDAAIATVSAAGVVTAAGPGAVQIHATRDGATGSAAITVTAANLVAAQLLLTPAHAAEGTTLTASLTVTNAGTAPAPATRASIELVSAAGGAVLATHEGAVPALAPGASTVLTAAFPIGTAVVWPAFVQARAVVDPDGTVRESSRADNDAVSAAAEIIMAVAGILPTPAAVELDALGRATTVAVRLEDRHGHPLNRPVAWLARDTTVARVSPAGVITAAGNGDTEVEIRVGSLMVIVPVRVRQEPAAVALTPAEVTFDRVGGTQPLQAVVRDALGGLIAAPTLSWSSADPAVVSVSTAGVLTAVADGSARIIAAAGAAADTVAVTVEQLPAAVHVPDDAATVRLGQALQLAAHDSAGQPIPPALLSWSVVPAARGVIDSDGVFQPLAVGDVVLHATRGAAAAAFDLTIVAPNLHIEALSVPANVVEAGSTVHGTLRIRNDGTADAPAAALAVRVRAAGSTDLLHEQILPQPPVGAGAVVELAVAAAVPLDPDWPGTIYVQVVLDHDNAIAESDESDNTAASGTIEVRFPVHALAVVPATLSLDVGASQALLVELEDAFGRPLSGRPVTFVSTNVEVATVTADGVVTAMAPGSASIEVSAESVSTAVPVSVSGEPAAIVVIAGSPQTGTVGQPLPLPITVEVRDAAGRPVPGVALAWTLTGWVDDGLDPAAGDFAASTVEDGAAGALSTVTSLTDAEGRAAVVWQLGHRAGLHRAHVRVTAGDIAAELVAHARPGPPRRGARRQGGLTATVMPGLTDIVEIQIFDEFDNAVPDVEVLWQVQGGGPHSELPGGGQSATSTTDALGVTSLEWAFGTQAGLHRLRVSVDGTPVTLEIEKQTRAGPLARLNLSPKAVELNALDETTDFTVSPEDEFGNPIQDVALVWGSDDDQTVEASPVNPGQGRARSRQNGTATIRVTGSVDGVTVVDTAEVVVAQQVDGGGITIVGDTTVVAGSSLVLTASGTDPNDKPINQFRWSIVDAGTAHLEIVGSDKQPSVELRGRAVTEVQVVAVRVADPKNSTSRIIEITVLPAP